VGSKNKGSKQQPSKQAKSVAYIALSVYCLVTNMKALCRMPSSGMLPHVILVIADVSEEGIAYNVRVTRIGELGTMLVLIGNQNTQRRIQLVVTINFFLVLRFL
jgi:hypothetical protein